jgi:fluoride exporter
VTLLVLAIGGAFGAVSRYLVSEWVQDAVGTAFPWGTMAVNVVGSLVLGFALVWMQTNVAVEIRQFVTLGFLASFTTFSTFSYEAVALLRGGDWWKAGGYVAGSVALALVAVGVGMVLASTLARTDA